MTSDSYHCEPHDYLARAKERLEERGTHSLFYAAFELRCFVERRMEQYLDAQERYRASLPKRWKIGYQAKELEKIYSEKLAQRLSWVFPNGEVVQFLYVPVSGDLITDAERLGEFLHSRIEPVLGAEAEELHERLSGIFGRAEACASGNMLCPALLDKSNGRVIGTTIAFVTEDVQAMLSDLTTDAQFLMKVEYLDVGHRR